VARAPADLPTIRRIPLPGDGAGWRPSGMDVYHALLSWSWMALLLRTVAVWVAANALFATLYALQPGSVTGAQGWIAHFFFSVQTMATIGYGVMAPHTGWAHALVTVEALVGMLGTALASGLIFAKLAAPRANVAFSRVVVVAPRNGVPTLQLRMANARSNRMLEAQVRVSLLRDERTAEGEFLRTFEDLTLVRASTPVFALTWTVVHTITPESPFARLGRDGLRAANAQLHVSLVGVDDTFAQAVHARWTYDMDAVAWDARFVDVFARDADGARVLDLRRFHDTEPLAHHTSGAESA
jgi:inward rectifier potassium channel